MGRDRVRHTADDCDRWRREAAVAALPDLPSDQRSALYDAAMAAVGVEWRRLPHPAREMAVAQVWLDQHAA